MAAMEDSSKVVTHFKDALIVPNRPEHVVPTYRILEDGKLNTPDKVEISDEEVIRCYKGMVTLNEMDSKLYDIQRQGLISFYMTSYGEEAIHYGSAAALDMGDVVFAQYREVGVLMYRGFTVQNVVDQCYSNIRDLGKGRQMPIHYGSKELNYQTISSTLGTQIPNAAGAGYAMKMQGKPNCAVCYFGDGAASEGDFHAALNFAATLGSATIFICRNNKWAISTPTRDQYRGDAIAGRGVAYGMHTIRVDGNDFFAIYNATKEARRIAVEEGRPVLIETMTYRVGHHSTSDDFTRYREQKEVSPWQKDNPITRLRLWLENQGLWDNNKNDQLKKEARESVIAAMKEAEVLQKPKISDLFTDVYDKETDQLRSDREKLFQHLAKYPNQYPIDIHLPES
uniref:2-oxoisovalerate dehydrogenase subunit alpha n=1 Tax=Arcella intermedia TaxID=1963864 RepID=A0A6B2L6F6_9EUKA